MRLIVKESCTIAATREKVWEMLCDLELMELWNPKCVHCEPVAAELGCRFHVTFSLGRNPIDQRGEIVSLKPLKRLRILYRSNDLKIGGETTEWFDLEDRGERCDVAHTVDMSRSGLPWFVVLIAKGLYAFGMKRGASSLDGLRALSEGALDS